MVKDYSCNYEKQRVGVIKDVIPSGSYTSLDVGCGNGMFSKILFDKGHKVDGIDINIDNIKFAQEKYGACQDMKFFSYDLSNIKSYSHKKYDFILALEILEHLPNYDQFLMDLCGLLKKNGLLVISTPNRYSIEGLIGTFWAKRLGKKFNAWDITHQNVFNSFEFLKSLKEANLNIKKICGYYYSSSDRLPLLKFRISMPFYFVRWFPLNMFGFNTIIVSQNK